MTKNMQKLLQIVLLSSFKNNNFSLFHLTGNDGWADPASLPPTCGPWRSVRCAGTRRRGGAHGSGQLSRFGGRPQPGGSDAANGSGMQRAACGVRLVDVAPSHLWGRARVSQIRDPLIYCRGHRDMIARCSIRKIHQDQIPHPTQPPTKTLLNAKGRDRT